MSGTMQAVATIDAPGFGGFGLGFAVVVALVLLAAWIILAASRLVQGGVVERADRVPQLYGYSVCLIALIWALVSLTSIVDNALSLTAPELRGASEFSWEPSVTSFEAFRASYDRTRRMGAPDSRDAQADSIPDGELRRRYEALRTDRIQRNRYQARHALVTSTLSLLIAAALFLFHWRWLRRPATAASA